MPIALIETSFHDTVVITGDDAAAVNRAVAIEVRRMFGDQLGAEDGPWFLAEHPYPEVLTDTAEVEAWVTAAREKLLHPWIVQVSASDHIHAT